MWIIRYENVPDTPSGTGGVGGSADATSTPSAVVFLHDIVAIVNVDTGVVEEVSSDLPDTVARGAPTANPNKSNTP